MGTRAGLDHKIVIQAAAKMADEDSLHELTMASLAARLNVRTPTLYHYLPDGLAGLRRELALMGLLDLTTHLGRAVMGKAGDDAVIALAHAMRTFTKDHPGLYIAASHAPEPGDTEWQAIGNGVVEIFLAALSAYQLPEEEALHAVRIFRSIIGGFASLENMGAFKLPLETDETFRQMIQMFLREMRCKQEKDR